ncbi:MAG: hypothetical protein ACK5JJ_14970 [Cyanobacteriota bacterium]|jgi:nucleoid DNA-binding protein
MRLEELIESIAASADIPRDVARKSIVASLETLKELIERGEDFTSPIISFTADTNKTTGRRIARMWIPEKKP